jgi:sacsin
MRAIVCKALGDPATTPLGGGVLELVADAPPPPSPLPKGCVRVQVAAASLNFPDALQIKVWVH